MSLCSICHLLFFLSICFFFTVSPSASLTCASHCKCNGCPAASVSEWQAYSQMWAGNLTARWKCQMYYRSILVHAVFRCNSQEGYFLAFVLQHENLRLSAWGLKNICQAWSLVSYDLWQWYLAASEDDAWSHTIGWVHRAHNEWLVQYRGSNEKRSKETKWE